jgi:TctA family transporter
MDSGTRTTVTVAASLAGLSFVSLLIGVPMILNDVANLEEEVAQQRQTYLDTSNRMWRELMEQGETTRVQRSTFDAERRQRRQCS